MTSNQGKDIIIVVINVSPSVRASKKVTFLEKSQQCLSSILQRKIFLEKCGDCIGIVLCGLQNEKSGYPNVSAWQKPQRVDWEMLHKTQELPNGEQHADFQDGLLVAMDLIQQAGEELFINKKIVLMTDFSSECDETKTKSTIQSLKNMQIELSVIGPDLEDTSKISWNGAMKTPTQLEGEALVQNILAEVNGCAFSFQEAIPQLILFEKKTQGSAAWNVRLTLGDSLKIPVTGRIKIKQSLPATWKEAYAANESMAVIPRTVFSKTSDDQVIQHEDELIRGYQYGSTVVPFGEEDKELKYQSGAQSAELSILGFSSSKFVPLQLRSGDQVLMISAKQYDDQAATALSALIQALKQLDMVAITRKVYRKNLNPVMGALFPEINDEHECLVWVGLPFQEDVRNYSFPSLESFEKRLTDSENNVMDQFIKKMTVDCADSEEDLFDPMNTLNPRLQYHFSCLSKRAVSPKEPLPEPADYIKAILSPRPEQLEATAHIIAQMRECFPTEEKVNKKSVNAFHDIDDKNNIGHPKLETSITKADLKGDLVTKITSVSPAEDFVALVKKGNFSEACQQMECMILKLVDLLTLEDKLSLDKILEAVRVFRQQSTTTDPCAYNSFANRLKDVVLCNSLQDLWSVIVKEKLGLISNEENETSPHTVHHVTDFYTLEKKEHTVSNQLDMTDEDFEGLLDQL